MEFDKVRLSRVMKSRRAALGWTQADLADASGVSAGVISDYERGATDNPQFPSLVKLANSLGCTVDDFVRREVANV